MANLVNGKISNEEIAKINQEGEFERPDSSFRSQIPHHLAVPDRYHLFVSYACPWAHRTLIVRNLKKLDKIINVSVTEAFMGDVGWTFKNEDGLKNLSELYIASDKNYTGKISVPVLWDKEEKIIVNNESAEIIRIFDSAFENINNTHITLYPETLRLKIDQINNLVYHKVNNGVYKAGFARSQRAYEKAFDELFGALDYLDEVLENNAFLVGEYFTEADIRLFTTLIRFDPVYFSHFKCNQKRIIDYKNLPQYMKAIYQMPEVKSTCRFDHIKEHYYTSHAWINPSRIIPKGPLLDLDSPHNRGEIKMWKTHH
jgi:putative glutathione S-transferase